MSDPARLPRMTSHEFIAWAMLQPDGKRYELIGGGIVAMAPERSVHALAKGRIYRRLVEQIEAAGLPCTVYPDGMSVIVDDETTYEPDVMIRRGKELPDDAVKVFDPLIIVEVAPPSTQSFDADAKLADYFRLASVRHYVIARTKDRVIVHHVRDDAGTITTRIVRDGTVKLDPPGITVHGLFG